MTEHKGELSALIAAIREGLEGVTPGPYEARYAPTLPLETVNYGVISLSMGREVCRVWEREDAELSALLSPDNIARLLDALASAEARALAAEKERDGYRSALTMIAHTFAENSFGGDKLLPANEYQDMARQALKGKTP